MGDLVQFRPKPTSQGNTAHNEMILDRIRGVPANVGPIDPREPGYPINCDPNAKPVA